MYLSTKPMPYVYQCTNPLTGEFYIGYREANVKKRRVSGEDLPKYKTSSKIVKSNFDKFQWMILAEFLTGDYAWEFEQSLIRDNWNNPLLLNANYQFNGIKKIRNKGSSKGKKLGPHSVERRLKNSLSQIGNKRGPHSAEHKEKIGAAQRGIPRIPRTEESKKKQSISTKGVKKGPQQIIECPHCGMAGGAANMKKWHFDYCKNAPNPLIRPKSVVKVFPKAICPHCNKVGGTRGMHRYHFDNCKVKTQ